MATRTASRSPGSGGRALSTNPVNRIDATLAAQPSGLWPFIPAGYPSVAFTASLLRGLESLPIRGVEIGFPFSDPIADGPVIQEAFTHSLAAGTRVDDIFALIASVRRDVSYPILGMVSASIIYRIGADEFIARAAAAGIDGLIIPDISLEEAPAIVERVHAAGLRVAMLVAPTTPPDRQDRIARLAGGFLYYVSVQGTTGARGKLPPDLRGHLEDIRQRTQRPVLVGFGIGTADQVREVCTFADGAIVGSAIVARISQLVTKGCNEEQLLAECMLFVAELAGPGAR